MTTHCFIHREALVAKTLKDEVKLVLNQVVKMVNYVPQVKTVEIVPIQTASYCYGIQALVLDFIYRS